MNNLMFKNSRLLLVIPLMALWGCQAVPQRSLCDELTCSGHGSCTLQRDNSGKLVPTCTCDAGYSRSGSQGWLCIPDTDDGLCAGVTCSSHGSCKSHKGKPLCTCDTGYTVSTDGKSCADPCAKVTCSGNGTCSVGAAGPVCACKSGYRLSADGKSCDAVSKGTYYIYKFIYNSYPTYQMGRAALDVTELSAGKLVEHLDFGLRFDHGGRGLRRKARQVWTLDASGKQVTAATLDDEYIQAKTTRRRRASATFAAGVASITMQRLQSEASHQVKYSGAKTPVPMLGGFEYPGWTLGCFSPAFYMLALQRYDAAKKGTQRVLAYWPSTGAVERVRVQADAAWTTSKPMLLFPDHATRVTYDDKGIPDKIELLGQSVSWRRYSGVPADLNISPIKAATPVKPAALPSDLTQSTTSFSSADGTPLAGTLALPAKTGKAPYPAVLMVTDPWAGDRDTPHRSLMRAPLYRHLAAHLAHGGYASLRYDPRTRSASTGSKGRVTLSALVADAGAALKVLAASAKVDPTRIYLLSLGTSSVVAVTLLSKGAAVKGYLGIAPVLDSVPKVMIYSATKQLEISGFSKNFLASQGSGTQRTMDQIQSGGYNQQSWQTLPLSLWKDYLAFDGDELLAVWSRPVLLLRGGEDMETPATQLKAAAAAANAPGKKDLPTKTLTGLTFILSKGKMSTLWEEAFLPFEVPTEATGEILGWLKKN